MIAFDAKPETPSSTSSVSSLDSKQEKEPTLSFSELLSGVVLKKDDTKVLKDGALLLSLEGEEKPKKGDTKLAKNDSLLSLLSSDTADLDDESLDLNTKLTNDLSSNDLKNLVSDAKQYLKDQITASDGYKRSEIKELPQTLKGLTQVAQKYGIDVSKITLEEVQVGDKNLKKETPLLKLKNKTTQNQVVDKNQNDVKFQEELKTQTQIQTPKELKTTPLFKAQTQTEHSTEQIVQTKIQRVEQKKSKTKADDTLTLLLRGEKASKSETGLTADFSVATAKVIAPSAKTESSKNLESLLSGEKKDETTSFSKTDGLNVNKADSFEVKINEAKQMTKYLSQDVKTAIDDYKSPFTRVKVQLNPQRLGEVDLTIVQRGKNLHINLSSNNSAINTLALNVNDLKVQLQNNGINNATLNFNNSSQGGEQAASQQQQQHQQREQKANEEYNFFSNQEENEEILSSLEIVVPHYA